MLQKLVGEHFGSCRLGHDGQEGLALFRSWHPDLVVTDIVMPDMDGLEMATQIHREAPDTPVLVLTAHNQPEHLIRAIDARVAKYLTKPFDPEQLIDALDTLADEVRNVQAIPLLEPFAYQPHSTLLTKWGRRVALSPRESHLIKLLATAPDRTMETPQIKQALWDDPTIGDEHLRSLIRRIRAKTVPELIETRFGMGYRLRGAEKPVNPS
jgi:DNA-binding response OmpR family regulator